MAGVEELRRAGEIQARLCADNDAPTYAAIIGGIVDRLDDEQVAAVRLLRRDPSPDPVGSALYLRLLGAVHRRALADPGCPLREYFPTTGGRADPDRAVGVFLSVVADDEEIVAEEMRHQVQTNEVGRAVPLMAALSYVVGVTRGPLRLLEPGASAGLNLWPDRYRIEAGAVAWGPADSSLRLAGYVASGRPPHHEVAIVARRGCDLSPIDIGTARGRLLLRSFVWPDHVERLGRLDAAIEAAGPAPIDRSPARSWVAEQLAEAHPDATTVVFHSMLLPYLTADEREKFKDTVRQGGAAADGKHRLAWVWLEPERGQDGVVLGCQIWPGGDRVRLATASPHGRNVHWQPTEFPTA